MANDREYAEAIARVKNGTGNSWDRNLAERAAKSHNFSQQDAAKDALGW